MPKIFPELSQPQSDFFKAVQYSSAALVARTYPRADTQGDKAIAFPRREGIELASVTLSPEPDAGDATYATVKTYASGAIAPRLIGLPDQDLSAELIAAMEPAHNLVLRGDPEPVATHVQKWSEALPFFDVGHFGRLRQFADGAIEDKDQPLTFAGDYLSGPYMEGAFTSGIRAADRLAARMHP